MDFIFGLPTMKECNISIQPSNDLVLIVDIPFSRESQPHRVSCFFVDWYKNAEKIAKAARNKQIESELFLVSLHFAEESESIKTNFGPELDIHLKELVTKFVDVTQEPQGLRGPQNILGKGGVCGLPYRPRGYHTN
jgi:hypothetical protein